jgi:hypothetical protein
MSNWSDSYADSIILYAFIPPAVQAAGLRALTDGLSNWFVLTGEENGGKRSTVSLAIPGPLTAGPATRAARRWFLAGPCCAMENMRDSGCRSAALAAGSVSVALPWEKQGEVIPWPQSVHGLEPHSRAIPSQAAPLSPAATAPVSPTTHLQVVVDESGSHRGGVTPQRGQD